MTRKPKAMAEIRPVFHPKKGDRGLPILDMLRQAAGTLIQRRADLPTSLGSPFLLYLLGFEIWVINDHGIMLAASLGAMVLASWFLASAALCLAMGHPTTERRLPEALGRLLLPCPLSRLFRVLFIAALVIFLMVAILFIAMIFIVMITNRYGLIFPELTFIGILSALCASFIFFRFFLAFPAAMEESRDALAAAWHLSRGRAIKLAAGSFLALLPGLWILLAVLLAFGDLRQSDLPGFTVYYFDLDLPLPGGWITLQALIVAASLVAVLNGALVMAFLAKTYERLNE